MAWIFQIYGWISILMCTLGGGLIQRLRCPLGYYSSNQSSLKFHSFSCSLQSRSHIIYTTSTPTLHRILPRILFEASQRQ